MLAEDQGRVLDEHRVGVGRELREANDREPGVGQRLLIVRVLRRGPLGIDRNALQMSEFAFGDAWAHGARESARHQTFFAMISATSGVTICAPGGGSSSSRAIVL